MVTEGTFNKQLPKNIRGALNGIQSLVASVGVLVFVKLGGILFDLWSHKAPYYLLAFMDGLFLLLVLGVKLRGQFPEFKARQKKRNHLSD